MHILLDSDYLPVILDYVGFVPARYYLRNSCRDAKKRISASVCVTPEECAIAIRERLVPLKCLKVEPLKSITSEKLADIFTIPSIEETALILAQVLRGVSPAALAAGLSWSEIERIKWTGWLSRNTGLLKLGVDARNKKRPNVAHFETQFLIDYKEDFHRFFRNDPVEYLSVVLRTVTIPRSKDDWDFLIMNALGTKARKCLDLILDMSRLDLGDFPGVIAAVTESGDSEFLQFVISSNDCSNWFIRDQIFRSLQIACRECMEDVCAILLSALGPKCLVNFAESSYLHALVMGNESGKIPSVKLAKLLVSYGANPLVSNREGETIVDVAALNGFDDLVEYFKSLGAKCGNPKRILLESVKGKNLEKFKSIVGIEGHYIDTKWIKNQRENPSNILEYASNPNSVGSILLFLLDVVGFDKERRVKILCDCFWGGINKAAKDGLFAERLDMFRAIIKRLPGIASTAKQPEGILPMGRLMCISSPHRRVWDSKILPQEDLWETRLEPRKKIDEEEESEDDSFDYLDEYNENYEDIDEFIDRGIRTGRLDGEHEETKKRTNLEQIWDQSVVDNRQSIAIETIKLTLVANGATRNRGFTPESLGYIVKEDRFKYIRPYSKSFMELMIRNGADVNKAWSDGIFGPERPLERYATYGCVSQCESLVDNGALVDSEVLISAVCTTSSNRDVLGVLLGSKTCDINGLPVDNGVYNLGVLHTASQSGNLENCKLLIDAGADVNLKSGKGSVTAFMLAFMNRCYTNRWKAIAQLLKQKGADINARDDNGQTTIFVAAIRGQLDEFKWLLENGADPMIPDEYGVLPIQVVAFILRFYPRLLQKRVKKFRLIIRKFGGADDLEHMDTVWFPCQHQQIFDMFPTRSHLQVPDLSDRIFADRYGLETIAEHI